MNLLLIVCCLAFYTSSSFACMNGFLDESGELPDPDEYPELPDYSHELESEFCENPALLEIVKRHVNGAADDPLGTATHIQTDAETEIGGHYQAVVSDCEFAYVNWYSGDFCKIRHGETHVLVWKD